MRRAKTSPWTAGLHLGRAARLSPSGRQGTQPQDVGTAWCRLCWSGDARGKHEEDADSLRRRGGGSLGLRDHVSAGSLCRRFLRLHVVGEWANGVRRQQQHTHRYRLQDRGDTIYIRYGFTSTICGTSGSACAPSSSSTFRLQKSSKDYRESITVQPGSSTYIILKLCNDDAPPDTCSEWKRTSA